MGRRGSSLEFTIPSEDAAARDVQNRILADVASHGFHSQSAWAIRLALGEAMTNAIKHGNRRDPNKKVHIQATVTPRQTEIIIEDEGGGFDRSSVPNPTLRENLEKCNGRGILLIESYMNKVEWSDGGRRLRMIKRNEPDVPAK